MLVVPFLGNSPNNTCSSQAFRLFVEKIYAGCQRDCHLQQQNGTVSCNSQIVVCMNGMTLKQHLIYSMTFLDVVIAIYEPCTKYPEENICLICLHTVLNNRITKMFDVIKNVISTTKGLS